MFYNQYDRPNHNQESNFSPLNDPGMNVYPIQSIYVRPCPKKVFPCYSSGTNSELPDYLKLPILFENRYSIDHSAKKRNKKLFLDNFTASQVFANNSQEERPRRRRYISSLTTNNNDNDSHYYCNQVTMSQSDLDKKYGLRKFDIISNRNYVPFKHIHIVPERNMFSKLFKIKEQIKDEDELRVIANRYRKLNGGEYARHISKMIPPKFNIY